MVPVSNWSSIAKWETNHFWLLFQYGAKLQNREPATSVVWKHGSEIPSVFYYTVYIYENFCKKRFYSYFYLQNSHTCHKLWTEICEIRKNFKGDLIKFCEIFTKITLELPQNSQKPLFWCKKLVINKTKSDLCLFLHKMCCKMAWKFCEIWKILWELASRWAKFCEILSHSVWYGKYEQCNQVPMGKTRYQKSAIRLLDIQCD